ncbi:MAG: DNA-directed RNA polymerase subunit omega [Pyrinomonadaceae bacterium MAG19_C2-C3]|nr:DNA-directed RNA polymerase subunit omega [Pyrinomonadaceae bacterium MAG19_C2-C3]
MAKKAEPIKPEETIEATEEIQTELIDSKYRMIIIAAQRSKQLQRGARPRVDEEAQKHKNTRIAIMEVQQGKVGFEILKKAS